MEERIRASHILFENENQARDAWIQITNGEDFGQMARRCSKCPSGAQLGDLGPFTKGVMVPVFEDAAFSLEVGEMSDPIPTQFGWHLIKRTE